MIVGLASNKKTDRRSIRVDAVLDIEGENWDTFVLGGILHRDGTYRQFWGSDNAEYHLVQEVLSVEGTVWGHFAGGYDYKWLLDFVYPDDYETNIIPAGTRIVTMQVGQTRFCDSFALVPMKLEKFTASQGVSKKKLDIPCRCGKVDAGKECDRYCSIKRFGMPANEKRKLEEYLRADCQSLMEGLDRLCDFAAEHDLDLGPTIGGSAWRNLRRTAPGIYDASLQRPEYHFAKSAYFGGKVQVYDHNFHPKAIHADIASEYPWTMHTFDFPIGEPIFRKGFSASKAYDAGKHGIYKAFVKTPEQFLPSLPVRASKGNLSFPYGEFSGNWTLPELQYAEQTGTHVEIVEGLVWPEGGNFFKQWVDRIWALRKKVGKDTPLGKWLKLYLNSISGKFGMSPFRDQFDLNLKGTIRACECVCKKCFKRPPCRCGQMPECECGAPIEIYDNIWHSTKYHMRAPYYVGDACAHIEWSSYITSYARIELTTAQRSIDWRNLLYSDTDSMFALEQVLRRPGVPEDPNLGEWIVSLISDFQAFAPKVHYYRDAAQKLEVKAKGLKIPKGEIPEVGRVYDSGGGVHGIRKGVKEGKFFVRNEIQRKLSERSGDRIKMADGKTRAPHISEVIDDAA